MFNRARRLELQKAQGNVRIAPVHDCVGVCVYSVYLSTDMDLVPGYASISQLCFNDTGNWAAVPLVIALVIGVDTANPSM